MGGPLEKRRRYLSQIPLLMVLICSVPTSGFAADDDYLKSLEAETSKINLESARETVEAGGAELSVIDEQRANFEAYLEEKQRGTYAFYRKLPERSREEVFNSFIDGASMDQIRKMVIDRKMNR